jgi:hypothetical protein
METPGRSRQSSNSPAPFFLSPILALAPMAVGIQPLPSNGSSCDTETYVSYPASGYSQENDELATHAEYVRNSIVGMSSGYGSDLPSVSPIPSTPLFPYDEEFVDDTFSAYTLPDGIMPEFPASSGYDPNMIDALRSISRLNDSQQQEIAAYLQKKRSFRQPTMADHTYGLEYGCQVPIPRSNPVPGMKATHSSSGDPLGHVHVAFQTLNIDRSLTGYRQC